LFYCLSTFFGMFCRPDINCWLCFQHGFQMVDGVVQVYADKNCKDAC
jgi:hypothetical protein